MGVIASLEAKVAEFRAAAEAKVVAEVQKIREEFSGELAKVREEVSKLRGDLFDNPPAITATVAAAQGLSPEFQQKLEDAIRVVPPVQLPEGSQQ